MAYQGLTEGLLCARSGHGDYRPDSLVDRLQQFYPLALTYLNNLLRPRLKCTEHKNYE